MGLRIVPDVVENQTIKSLGVHNTAHEAANMMIEFNIAAVLVTDDSGKLLGIATERDMTRRVLAPNIVAGDAKLGDIMTSNPVSVSPTDSAQDALELMRTRKFRHLPVLDGDKVVGMVSIRDLYDAVKESLEESVRETEAFVFGDKYSA